MNKRFLGLAGTALVVMVGLSTGCASSKDVEDLKKQVKDLNATITQIQQNAADAARVANQSIAASNDAKVVGGQALQKADQALQAVQAVEAAMAAKATAAAPKKKGK